MLERLAISTTRVDKTVVISAAGEIDASTASQLAEALSSVGEQDVVVSLERINYIDSSGLTVLVRSHKRRPANGSRLLVVLPAPPADRVFEITHIASLLLCFRSVSDALRAAQEERPEASAS